MLKIEIRMGSNGRTYCNSRLLSFEVERACKDRPFRVEAERETGGGRSFKGIIWSKKREKSVVFFCGQMYSWTKVLRVGLLARAYALIFRNLKPSLYNQKKEEETLIYWPSCTAGDGLLATVSGFGFDVAACAPLCLRRGIRVRPCSLRRCVYLPCGLQVQPLDLSWPCLLRATEH